MTCFSRRRADLGGNHGFFSPPCPAPTAPRKRAKKEACHTPQKGCGMAPGVARVIRTDASTSRAASSPTDAGLVDRGYAGSCPAMLKAAQMGLCPQELAPKLHISPQRKLKCPAGVEGGNCCVWVSIFHCQNCTIWSNVRTPLFLQVGSSKWPVVQVNTLAASLPLCVQTLATSSHSLSMTCECGEEQTTDHPLQCSLSPVTCTMEDLLTATPEALPSSQLFVKGHLV
ncbi:CKLF-like MARVEL transmembrane domain-containing protein 7 isoform X3 [Anolis carolinensis]|uniref:CKLF-like MARVEL transmembrane domain-containing protein 7 isoform X3 n=1 Tax=Anolis carolinensis TaxID=28377 RepID=UPI002F2B7F92